MPHDIIRTTAVLIAVASVEFTPSIPIFASIDVTAAKTADRTANTIYIYLTSYIKISFTESTACATGLYPRAKYLNIQITGLNLKIIQSSTVTSPRR